MWLQVKGFPDPPDRGLDCPQRWAIDVRDPWADLRRRAHPESVLRSSSVNTNSAFGRPRDAIGESSYPPT
jgi:hypothetical protein